MNSASSRGMSAAKSAAKCGSSIHQSPLLSDLNAVDACGRACSIECATLAFIERKGGNVDKRCNVWMIAGFGDDGPAVAVADQNHWSAHSVDCGLRVLLVVGVRSLGRLRYRHLVAIILQYVSDSFPAGAIGESTVHQDHVLNMLFHDHSPFQLGSTRTVSFPNANAFAQGGSHRGPFVVPRPTGRYDLVSRLKHRDYLVKATS